VRAVVVTGYCWRVPGRCVSLQVDVPRCRVAAVPRVHGVPTQALARLKHKGTNHAACEQPRRQAPGAHLRDALGPCCAIGALVRQHCEAHLAILPPRQERAAVCALQGTRRHHAAVGCRGGGVAVCVASQPSCGGRRLRGVAATWARPAGMITARACLAEPPPW
jgi:hypothetical protein